MTLSKSPPCCLPFLNHEMGVDDHNTDCMTLLGGWKQGWRVGGATSGSASLLCGRAGALGLTGCRHAWLALFITIHCPKPWWPQINSQLSTHCPFLSGSKEGRQLNPLAIPPPASPTLQPCLEPAPITMSSVHTKS